MSRTVGVWSYGGNFIKSTPIVKTVFYERQCYGDYSFRSGGADGSKYKNHALYFAERGCYDEEKSRTAKKEVSAMLQSEKVKRAIDAVEEACGHCAVCSPDCPIAIADRALQGLYYDLQQAEQASGD